MAGLIPPVIVAVTPFSRQGLEEENTSVRLAFSHACAEMTREVTVVNAAAIVVIAIVIVVPNTTKIPLVRFQHRLQVGDRTELQHKAISGFSSRGGGRGGISKGRGFILTTAISCNSRVPCMQVFPPPFFRRSSTIHRSMSGPGGEGGADDSSARHQMLAYGSGGL